VKSAIRGCDVVTVRTGARILPVCAELNLEFSPERLLQDFDRTATTGEVRLATRPVRQGRRRQSRVIKLCQLLDFGPLTVGFREGAMTILAAPTTLSPLRRFEAPHPGRCASAYGVAASLHRRLWRARW